ncbi:hypothetical protein E2C01_012496 [Portunus trituberculatus]|uniref:Uncharacterized protein n=1 Tax=Portunus trituberculatus TaxID=210409 RepID=A0A5B7DE56_PORTR|nr:hypothetical protein [Portunus trituberculatus]
MFVHDRAETSLPKHPSLDIQPSNTGRPLLGDSSSGQLRWSTGTLRRNHLLHAPFIQSATRKAAPARRAVVRASRSCLGSVTPIACVVALHEKASLGQQK